MGKTKTLSFSFSIIPPTNWRSKDRKFKKNTIAVLLSFKTDYTVMKKKRSKIAKKIAYSLSFLIQMVMRRLVVL